MMPFLFDSEDFKEIKINHTIIVNEIIYPENIKELKPAEIREQSKRKGIIKRIINKDGSKEIKEAEFVA
jgi:hypothetical protein